MKPVLKNLTIIGLISSTLIVGSFYIPSVPPSKQNAGNNYNYPTDQDMLFYELETIYQNGYFDFEYQQDPEHLNQLDSIQSLKDTSKIKQ